jgi:ABC-2 type transport system permease protein
MSKLWLIVQREYLTRVRTRGFWLGTLLTPLAVAAFIGFQGFMATYKSGETQHVVLLDEGGFLKTGMPDGKGVQFTKAPPNVSLDSLKGSVRAKKYDGILRLSPLPNFSVKKHTFYYYSDEKLSPEVIQTIERRMSTKIRDFKIDSLHFDRKALGELDTDVSIDPEPIDKKDDNASSLTSGVAIAIAFMMGIAMYMLMLMWGSLVMRSVMEEKTNRIVEVIMSSVKPFDLMMGKIIGSAAVGLTQLILWGVLSNLAVIVMGLLFNFDTSAMSAPPTDGLNPQAAAEVEDLLPQIMNEVMRQNWGYIFSMMLLFFLGGYFLYAAMFAAIGSASGDDMTEGQQLAFPVMMPIIIAFILVATVVHREPNSTLSVFASIFPLFSPIVMPARLSFDPPLWQVLLSVVLLMATSVGFVWLSGRIYRVGILLYGKKVTLKEVWKWMFYKG